MRRRRQRALGAALLAAAERAMAADSTRAHAQAALEPLVSVAMATMATKFALLSNDAPQRAANDRLRDFARARGPPLRRAGPPLFWRNFARPFTENDRVGKWAVAQVAAKANPVAARRPRRSLVAGATATTVAAVANVTAEAKADAERAEPVSELVDDSEPRRTRAAGERARAARPLLAAAM